MLVTHQHRHGTDIFKIVVPVRARPSDEEIAAACGVSCDDAEESIDVDESGSVAPIPVGFVRPSRRPSTPADFALAAHMLAEARARAALGAIAAAAALRANPLPEIRAALRRCGLAPSPRKGARARR